MARDDTVLPTHTCETTTWWCWGRVVISLPQHTTAPTTRFYNLTPTLHTPTYTPSPLPPTPQQQLTLPEAACNIECHLKALLRVEARVAVCVVARLQIVLSNSTAATNTLSHIVTCRRGWVGWVGLGWVESRKVESGVTRARQMNEQW